MIDGVNMNQSTDQLQLMSPIPPSVNHYLAYRVVKKGNRYMAMSYKTKESTDYKKQFIDYVKKEVEKQGWKFRAGDKHLYVDCIFYFPRIDMDTNNYFKLLLDSITESRVVWDDDNFVCERVNRIFYDSKNPRIELVIYDVPYIGIFDTEAEKDQFIKKCSNCKRYARNCSILKNALNGKIQSDIENKICLKYKEME